MNTAENKNEIFPKGEKLSPDYFTGTAHLKMLVSNEEVFNCQIGNVVFEPGCRNNWHSHPSGQILICTNGEGYYQEKSKVIQLLSKGDVVQIKPGIIHWHGATPDSRFTHIAISPNAEKGIVDWLNPVTDKEYNNFKR